MTGRGAWGLQTGYGRFKINENKKIRCSAAGCRAGRGVACASAWAADEATLNVEKLISWDSSNKNNATITVTSNVPDVDETKVLFLGTLCNAHGMTSTTITNSLNAIAVNADVTYYLLGKDSTSSASNVSYKGSIERGKTLTQSISVTSSGNHASLKGFINILYSELYTNNKEYDYIILEFDSSRIADGSSSTCSSITTEMNWVANELAKYYANDQVIWVTDGFNQNTKNKEYGVTAYAPTNLYFTSKDGTTNHLKAQEFRYLCSVMAPAYYLAHTTADSTYYGNGSTTMTLTDYQLKLGVKNVEDKVYGTAPDYLVYSSDSRQMFYNNATELADFLYMAVQGVKLRFNDTVKVSDSDTIKITDAAIYVTKSTTLTNADWILRSSLTVASATVQEDEQGVKYVSSTDGEIVITTGNTDSSKNNQVTVNVEDLKNQIKYAKLVINVEDSEGFQSCIYLLTDENGKPVPDANGRLQYRMNPNNGEAQVSAYKGTETTGAAAASGSDAAVAADVVAYNVNSSVTNGTENYDENTQKGTVTSETATALALTSFSGDSVNLTYTPGSGKKLDSITVDGVSITLDESGSYTGTAFTVSTASNGIMTVTFPGLAADHSVSVVFKNKNELSTNKSVKSPASGTVKGGEEIEYTITVANSGSEAVSGVSVSDVIDTSLVSFVSADNNGSYDASTHTVSWSGISVPAAADGTPGTTKLSLKVRALPGITGSQTIINSAAGTYDGATLPDTTTNGFTAVTATGRDLTVTYSLLSGETPKDYTKPSDAAGTYGQVLSSDAVAAAQPSAVPGYRFSGWYKDQALTTAFDAQQLLNEENYTIEGNVITLYGKWEYCVGLEKTAVTTASPLRGGDTLTYEISVSNTSETAVSEITVTDVLSSQLEYVSSSPAASWDSATRTLSWSSVSVGANSSEKLTVRAKVDPTITAAAEISNTASGTHGGKSFSSGEEKVTAQPMLLTVKYAYSGDAPSDAPDTSAYTDEGIVCGKAYSSSGKNPTAQGYTFSGWYVDEACSVPYTNGSILTYADTVNGVKTLYGKWTTVKSFSLSKSVSYNGKAIDGTVAPGSTVLYTLTVVNNNAAAAIPSVVITDTVPEGLAISNISDGGSAAGSTVTWTVTLGAGESKDLSFNATVPADLKVEKSYVNVAAVTSADGTALNVPANVTFTAKPENITVAVTKAWSDGWDAHSDETVSVQMYANGTASGSVIALTKAAPSWSEIVAPYDAAGNPISYTFRELKDGAALEEGGMTGKDNRYKVSYSETETGGTLITNGYVIDAADLTLIKTADGTAVPGGSFTYTITLTNKRSNETAQNITVSDKLPEGLTLAENGLEYASTDSVTEENGAYVWTVPSLAGGETATLKITVDVPADAVAVEYENIASITNVGDTSYAGNPVPSEKAITDVRTFTVKKVWSDSKTAHPSVAVQLQRNGENYGQAKTLSDGNNWTFTWTGLPLYDDARVKYVYTVSEIAIEGYTSVVSYSGAADGNTSAAVTNTLKTVTVIYSLKGSDQPSGVSAPESAAVNWGESYNAASPLSAQNYSFSGWYTDEGCTVPYVNGTVLNDSSAPGGTLTLYGLWTRKTIDMDYESSSTGPDPSKVTMPAKETVKQGDELPVPADPVYSGDDYRFTGWYTDAACKVPYTGGTAGEENITLYAGWEYRPQVNYYAVGTVPEGAAIPYGERVDAGTAYTSKSAVGTPVGYTFDGWYTDADLTSKYTDGTKIYADTDLYGTWRLNPIVTYKYIGTVPSGITPPAAVSVPYGTRYTAATKPTYSSYTFTGWYTDSACTRPYTATTLTSDLTLYGKWVYNGGVKTGDNYNGPFWTGGLIFSLASLASAFTLRYRKKKHCK